MDFVRGEGWRWLAALPGIVAGVLAAAAAAGEVVIWRTIRRFVVR